MRIVTLFVILLLPLLVRAADETPTGFLVFGDFGTGSADQKAVGTTMQKYCKTNVCNFVLGMGDNFYPKGVESVDDSKWKTHFMDPYGALNLIFYASLGNHDYGGNVQAQIAYSNKNSLWFMPSRYYSFQKNHVEFYALDTNEFSKTQQNWLEEKLATPKTGWRIAYGHHPIYSYGDHGDTEEMVDELLPRLRKKADFYFSGHDHDKQVLRAEDDLILMVSGAASQARPTKQGPKSIYASDTLGFGHVLLNQDTATLRFVDRYGKVEFERTFTQVVH